MKRPFGTRVPFRNPTLPFRSCEMACEIPIWLWNGCENVLWLRNWPLAVKMALSYEMGCEMGYENAHWLRKWLLAGKRATKMPLGCEMTSKLRNWLTKWGRFAKTPCEAKGSCENANRAPRTCIWRGEPRAPWEHTWSLSLHFWPPKTIRAHSFS